MKAAFVGEYELTSIGYIKVINILKKYRFDAIYLFNTFNDDFVNECRKNNIKVILTINFMLLEKEEIISYINRFKDIIDGVCFDYIREESTSFFNIFKMSEIYLKFWQIKKEFPTIKQWDVCYKCEDYFAFFTNEINRLLYGQCIGFFKPLVTNFLMMSYHQEYNQPIEKICNMIDQLQKHYGDCVVPIFQTYQDIPYVDYTKEWKEVASESKRYPKKAYFRLGTCKPDSFL